MFNFDNVIFHNQLYSIITINKKGEGVTLDLFSTAFKLIIYRNLGVEPLERGTLGTLLDRLTDSAEPGF